MNLPENVNLSLREIAEDGDYSKFTKKQDAYKFSIILVDGVERVPKGMGMTVCE